MGKHVHAVWYIVASPVWQALDESFVRRLLGRVKDCATPVFILINKADTMTLEQLTQLKQSIMDSAGVGNRLAGECWLGERVMVKTSAEGGCLPLPQRQCLHPLRCRHLHQHLGSKFSKRQHCQSAATE